MNKSVIYSSKPIDKLNIFLVLKKDNLFNKSGKLYSIAICLLLILYKNQISSCMYFDKAQQNYNKLFKYTPPNVSQMCSIKLYWPVVNGQVGYIDLPPATPSLFLLKLKSMKSQCLKHLKCCTVLSVIYMIVVITTMM